MISLLVGSCDTNDDDGLTTWIVLPPDNNHLQFSFCCTTLLSGTVINSHHNHMDGTAILKISLSHIHMLVAMVVSYYARITRCIY